MVCFLKMFFSLTTFATAHYLKIILLSGTALLLSNFMPSGSENPIKLFDEFWQIFDDHYAFFELRNVDWELQKKNFRPKITTTTSEQELFSIFCQMIDPLDDGHVSISGKGFFNSNTKPAWLWESGQIQSFISEQYLHGKIQQRGRITYGLLDEETGYINITAMEGFDASDMDEATQALKRVKKVIVDVRFNGGGYDQTALALAGRFTDKKRYVYSKETFCKRAYSDRLDLYISPEGTTLITVKLVVLTSRATASAAEMFVMAMKAIPNAVIIGENTAGMHSDVYSVTLSNGWRLGLSNQKYVLPDGKVYEKTGLPPDITIPMNDILILKKDLILEKAKTL